MIYESGRMRTRTTEEIRAYADGYNAAYFQFRECLKNRKSVVDAIRKMDLYVTAVNNVIKTREESNG